jgi:hypothetical protein
MKIQWPIFGVALLALTLGCNDTTAQPASGEGVGASAPGEVTNADEPVYRDETDRQRRPQTGPSTGQVGGEWRGDGGGAVSDSPAGEEKPDGVTELPTAPSQPRSRGNNGRGGREPRDAGDSNRSGGDGVASRPRTGGHHGGYRNYRRSRPGTGGNSSQGGTR